LATRLLPMVPPAPVTFSTMICWPSSFDMGPTIMRAVVSDGPPGGNGDTSVMMRLG
jgi:hypothetical protein